MRKILLSILALVVLSLNLKGQQVRVNNSFIILIDSKLAEDVAGLRINLIYASGKEENITGGYYPGVLFVSTEEAKKMVYANNLKSIILSFDYYEYRRRKQFIYNYKIPLSPDWFKESLIIVKIVNINKSRGTYNYFFEVPGRTFGITKKDP